MFVYYQLIVSSNFNALEGSGLNLSEATFFSMFLHGQFRQGICTASAISIPHHVYMWEGYCSQCVCFVCYQLIVSSNFNILERGGTNLSEVIFLCEMTTSLPCTEQLQL